jgi:hypothetical protein
VRERDSLQPALLTCKGGAPGADPKGRNGVPLPGSAIDWRPSGVGLNAYCHEHSVSGARGDFLIF